MLKAKQIHLDEKVIEILTIKAVKQKTTFKELAQQLLTNIANDSRKANEPKPNKVTTNIK